MLYYYGQVCNPACIVELATIMLHFTTLYSVGTNTFQMCIQVKIIRTGSMPINSNWRLPLLGLYKWNTNPSRLE